MTTDKNRTKGPMIVGPPTEDRLAGLERRLAAAEKGLAEADRRLGHVWQSTIGANLRALQANAAQAEIEAGLAAEKAAHRGAASDKRVAAFERFIAERCTLSAAGRTATWAIAASYVAFCLDEKLTLTERLTGPELLAAVAKLPGVEDGIVFAGPLQRRMPGLTGVGLKAAFRHAHDARDVEAPHDIYDSARAKRIADLSAMHGPNYAQAAV